MYRREVRALHKARKVIHSKTSDKVYVKILGAGLKINHITNTKHLNFKIHQISVWADAVVWCPQRSPSNSTIKSQIFFQ